DRTSFHHALEQAAIDAGFGSLDRDCADGFGVEGGGADPADDRVAKTLLSHVFETGKEQSSANSLLAGGSIDARRAEEILTGRVMAGEAHQCPPLDRDEAGNRLARKRNIGFAGPGLAEGAADPLEHLVLLGRQRAADRYAGGGQAV